MKNSILLLCSLLFLCVFAGCGDHSLEESSSDHTSTSFQEQEETTEPEPIEAETEPFAEERADSFDMDHALEHTYLCGVQLAPDLTWGMLGEDFSVNPEGAVTSPGSEKISCDVNFKGQNMGVMIFQGCESVDQITEDTKISGILIQNSDTDQFDVPKISVCGVTFDDTHETLYEALGDSDTVTGINDNVKYCEPDSKRHYSFIFNSMGEDRLVSVSIMNP